MDVNIGKHVYKMTNRQANTILESVKKLADCNIYGLEKGNTIIMLNEKYEDNMSLKKAVGEYVAKGFKVYWK